MLSTVIGADEAKRVLNEAVSLHARFPPGTFVGVRRLPSAVLLYGPPGTGKTLLAQQLAADSGRRLVSVSPGSLLSMWTGESEKVLHARFREAAGEEGLPSARRYSPDGKGGEQQCSCSRERSRSCSPVRERIFPPSQPAPGILFLDEVDALAPKREGNSDLGSRRLLNELLILMSRYGEHGAGGGEEPRLLVIAATNRPEDCDPPSSAASTAA